MGQSHQCSLVVHHVMAPNHIRGIGDALRRGGVRRLQQQGGGIDGVARNHDQRRRQAADRSVRFHLDRFNPPTVRAGNQAPGKSPGPQRHQPGRQCRHQGTSFSIVLLVDPAGKAIAGIAQDATPGGTGVHAVRQAGRTQTLPAQLLRHGLHDGFRPDRTERKGARTRRCRGVVGVVPVNTKNRLRLIIVGRELGIGDRPCR